MIKKSIRILLSLLFISLLATPQAQQPTATSQRTAADRIALYQALLDLTNPWTVMCVAAHPDDEDGTSLIVMRRKYGAHTVSLFSTFGEGGQNAIGPELYEELGAIRARETAAAAEIQGSEPYFLGLTDFGYSKSADETFQKWGHDEALRRMVQQIRRLRPDVIITNHSVTSNDHGHHQATARLVVEAFDAAADPKRFPEQLKDDVAIWQVQRLFVRVRGNQTPAENAQLVTIDPNERDPVRDATFVEEALSGLQKHATQGPWPKSVAQMAARFTNSSDGRLPLIRYRLLREADGAASLTKESHNFLDGLRLTEEVAKELVVPMLDDRPLYEYAEQPGRVLAALLDAQKQRAHASGAQMRPASVDPRVIRNGLQFNAAVVAASGLTAKLILSQNVAEPGSKASFRLELSNKGAATVRLDTVIFGAGLTNGHVIMHPVESLKTLLAPGKTIDTPINYQIPGSAELTVPHAQHLYDGRVNGYPLGVSVLSEIQNVRFEILRKAAIDIGPQIEITDVNPLPFVFTSQSEDRPKSFQLQALNHGKSSVRTSIEVIEDAPGNNGPGRIPIVKVPVNLIPEQDNDVVLRADLGIRTFLTRTKSNGADGGSQNKAADALTVHNLIFRAANKLSNEVKVPAIYVNAVVARNIHVGYIRGFDFSLPNALEALGVESKALSTDEVKTTDLQKYSSIIVDNRVYESRPELIALNQKLLDYAKAGGTLIVFYHKSDEWNPDSRRNRPQLAPYKLLLGNERITDEYAPVSFLEPHHPLLNSPNKIGPDDFKGWIQERGLYYPKEWDPQFHALLESNDPGEPSLKGGLLVAYYGQGRYIYTSMVWYRQLRAGVPGAYRMLANMISYGRVK